MSILSVNGVALPAPISLKVDNEIIWSSNTGRVDSGDMVGDVIAQKKSISIEWGIMQEKDLKLISDTLIAGFFPFTFHDAGTDITIQTYRGTISTDHLGYLGDGYYWYSKVTVKIIQK